MANGPGKYYFILNHTDQNFTCVHDRTGYEAPAFKAARPQGKPDEEAMQFEEKDAALFISNVEDRLRPHFTMERVKVEAEDEDKVAVGAPAHRQEVKNAPSLDYPEGLPQMNWNGSQCRNYLRDNDVDILNRARTTTAVETLVLAVWKKHDPDRYDLYMRNAGGE